MSHPLFVGRISSTERTRKDVISISAFDAARISGYDNLAMMTLDGLLRPVSLTGDAGLPKNIIPGEVSGSGQINQPCCPLPPILTGTGFNQPVNKGYINVDYYQALLDPINNTGLFADPRATGSISGHDIEGYARGTTADITGKTSDGIFTIQDCLITGSGANGTGTNGSGLGYTGNARYLALRGPIMIQGPGFDLMGNPVPNASGDVSGTIDNFYTGKVDKFQPNWLQRLDNCPVAPLDIRLDRRRGMWVSPPPFAILEVKSEGEAITGSIGTGTVLTPGYYDSSGNPIETGYVTYVNTSYDHTIVSGEKLLLHYDINHDRYIPYNLASRNPDTIVAESEEVFSISSTGFTATVTRAGGGYQIGELLSVENVMGDNGGVGTKCFVYVDKIAGVAELIRPAC